MLTYGICTRLSMASDLYCIHNYDTVNNTKEGFPMLEMLLVGLLAIVAILVANTIIDKMVCRLER